SIHSVFSGCCALQRIKACSGVSVKGGMCSPLSPCLVFRDHIESAGHTCVLRDVADFRTTSDLALLMTQEGPFEGALAIHLFKGAGLLLDAGVPFGVVFGGTDVNEDSKDEHKRMVMDEVLRRTRFAVAFSDELKEKAESVLECGTCKIFVQAQGIETRVSSDFSWRDFLRQSDQYEPALPAGAELLVPEENSSRQVSSGFHTAGGLAVCCTTCCFVGVQLSSGAVGVFTHEGVSNLPAAPLGSLEELYTSLLIYAEQEQLLGTLGVTVNAVEDLRVFMLVCGLRRVKDPLYLLKAFSEWHAENPLVVLIIIGPKVDPVFSAEVEESVKRSAGVYLAGERSQEELHTAMQKSFALVNSSVSEGMSAAVLEAMDLELPVLARDIPGNAAIVKHEVTGLLYSSPEEFVSVSKRLLSDGTLQETLKRNGKRYVTDFHSPTKERTTYQQLVDMLH
ncbi:hypothetical protein NFI96_013323, partial [Prochilodus magdalenae]